MNDSLTSGMSCSPFPRDLHWWVFCHLTPPRCVECTGCTPFSFVSLLTSGFEALAWAPGGQCALCSLHGRQVQAEEATRALDFYEAEDQPSRGGATAKGGHWCLSFVPVTCIKRCYTCVVRAKSIRGGAPVKSFVVRDFFCHQAQLIQAYVRSGNPCVSTSGLSTGRKGVVR